MGWPWPHDWDIWWHLKTGEWIATHHTLPWTDPFGANTHGVRWIAYSWLSELLFYWINTLHPLLGLYLLQGAVMSATLAILLINAQIRSGSFRAALLLSTLFLPLMIPWVARPLIFSYMFTALTMLILWWGKHRNAGVLWILPLLLVLWANIHVYFIVGIGLIALHLLEEGIYSSRTKFPLHHLLLLIICTLAPLINPYGIHLYEQVLILTQDSIFSWAAGSISELASPSFHHWPMKVFFLWIALASVSLVLSEKKVDLLTLVLFIGLLYQSLQHQRDIPFFVIVMLPIIAEHLAYIPFHKLKAFINKSQFSSWVNLSATRGALHWLLACGIIPVIVALPFQRLSNPDHLYMENRHTELTGAVKYLLKERPSGPIFHPLDWGCYFIYTLTPSFKVYIDTRTQLYNNKFWKTFDQIRNGKSGAEKLLYDSGIRTVIWKKDDPLASLLTLSPHWSLAWSDEHVVIFIKKALDASPNKVKEP